MLEFLRKLFGWKRKPARPTPPAGGGTGAPAAKVLWEQESARDLDTSAPPEDLCGLKDGMTREDLQAHLAALYKRHNRAASSLDPKLRAEAELMLDAIVECRQKYLAG